MTDEPQTHVMTLTHTYPTGAILFTCPICHRELITDGIHRIALVRVTLPPCTAAEQAGW